MGRGHLLGLIGACEDQDEQEVRSQFETNFMGTLNIIQRSLPYFRSQSAGRYLIFSSIAGALGVPGLGPYCATKYAVEGLVESMLYEIDSFNIKATLVEPGSIRLDEPDGVGAKSPAPVAAAATGAAAVDRLVEPRPRQYGHFLVRAVVSEPYAGAQAPAGHARRMLRLMDDHQPASAVRSAELIWQLGHCSYPPLRLLIGSYSVDCIRDRLRSIIEEIEDWKHLNFPATLDEEQSDERNKEPESRQDQGEDELVDGVMGSD